MIIPTYNRPDILKRAIETCISQTYKDIEIIIVDDTKKSQQEMIDSYHDDRIVYMHNANPQGSPIARNIGISQAKGEYIAFLDDDDEWMPEKIELQVRVLEKIKHVGLCVCWMLDKRFNRERINKTPEVLDHRDVLNAFNVQSTSAYMFRADRLRKMGGFDTSLPSAQEYDIAIRISRETPIISISQVLVVQNKTEGQISENWTGKIKGLMAIYHKHRRKYSSISKMNHVKFVGMLGLFSMGYLIGNKIYNVIIPMKERYEG